MKKRVGQKLTLHKETLKRLESESLEKVNGGVSFVWVSCQTCETGCPEN